MPFSCYECKDTTFILDRLNSLHNFSKKSALIPICKYKGVMRNCLESKMYRQKKSGNFTTPGEPSDLFPFQK